MKKLIEIKDAPNVYIDDILSGDVDLIIERLTNLRQTIAKAITEHENYFKNKLTPIEDYKKIEVEHTRSFDEYEIRLVCYKEETDDEYNTRIKKENELKKKRKEAAEKKKRTIEENERKLYEELKLKYGGEDIKKTNDDFKNFKRFQLISENHVGKKIKDLTRILNTYDVDFRIMVQDGVKYLGTADLNRERLNFHVEKGIITHQSLG
jgi:hypothetical protein